MKKESAIMVFATGASQATSATSAGGTIPNNSAGQKPRYIRVTSTQPAYFRIGVGAQTAVATDLMVQPADAVILSVGAATNYAAIQVTTAGVVNVAPLDDEQ